MLWLIGWIGRNSVAAVDEDLLNYIYDDDDSEGGDGNDDLPPVVNIIKLLTSKVVRKKISFPN